ncbi:hypothetical protein ACJ41O_013554 [Fusarium nematophilum]
MPLPRPSFNRALAKAKAKKRSTAQPSRSRKRKSASPEGDGPRKRRKKTHDNKENSDDAANSSDHKAPIIEHPRLEDFEGPHSIPRHQYVWGPPPPPPKEEEFDEEETAPPPWIPDAYGDSQRPMPRAAATPRGSSDRANSFSRAMGIARDRIDRKKEARKKFLRFVKMPLEIREEIYRHVLVSNKPIPVYDGWRRVYHRERPGLSTGILMANKQINLEATRILYGENTFLYRLRDAPGPAHEMTGVRLLLNQNAYAGDENAAGGDSFEPRTINVAKYGDYFRHLTIQADHNRHTTQTQDFMVDAIKVFASDLGAACRPGRTNIYTLTLVVSPQCSNGVFTFVDFFKANSTLVEALKAICCKHLCIKIWNKYLNGGVGQSSSRILLNLHHLRFLKHLHQQNRDGSHDLKRTDLFRREKLMWELRRDRIKNIHKKLDGLEGRVLRACRKHVRGDGSELLLDEDFNDEYDHGGGLMTWEEHMEESDNEGSEFGGDQVGAEEESDDEMD